MKYNIQFGGGLGDVINQIYTTNKYAFLEKLKPEDIVDIVIICSNPFADELFKYHPKANQFNIKLFNWWHPKDHIKNMNKNNLSITENYIKLEEPINIYSSSVDDELISKLDKNNYLIYSLGAGTLDRNMPEEITTKILKLTEEFIPIQVGRTFERHGRYEPNSNIKINMIDALSVPGTINLIKKSKGLVTVHSALNIAAWRLRIPQLLLYPDSVQARHFNNKDEWSFGKDFPETFRSTFNNFSDSLVTNFINYVKNN